MKREAILSVIISIFCLLNIGAVIFLNNPKVFEKKNVVRSENEQTWSQYYTVGVIDVETKIECKGYVTISEYDKAVVSYVIPKKYNNVIDMKTGSEYSGITEEEAIFCEQDDAKVPFTIDFPFRVIDLTEDVDNYYLQIMNFNSLSIVAKVDSGRINEITADTSVCIEKDDGKRAYTDISRIGYMVQGNAVEVELDCIEGYLPGAEVSVVFITDIRKDVPVVSKDMVYTEGSKHYVYRCVSGTTDRSSVEKVYVEIGGLINGNMYEIISGLKLNDVLSLEQETSYYDKLTGSINE